MLTNLHLKVLHLDILIRVTLVYISANCRHVPGRCKSDLREKTCACIRYDAEDGWNEPPVEG